MLQPPIDCDLTNTCYIQQYMDHDPAPAAHDYQCAPLSYDTHSGTDFALPSLAMMETGVNVVASADGVVIGVRDDMADSGYSPETADQIKDRECGNGVRIDHGNGWTTQYCHMKRGSVLPRSGQTVTAGMPLGQVGLSGRTIFPHVHLSLEKNGKNIDPFDPDGTIDCAAPDDTTLWETAPAYRPGGLISVGFSDRVPEYAAIKAGTATLDNLTVSSPALVIWSYNFGVRSGDILRLSLNSPEGIISRDDITMEKTQALSFRAIGKKRSKDLWPKGLYIGSAKLVRAGEIIEEKSIHITLQ